MNEKSPRFVRVEIKKKAFIKIKRIKKRGKEKKGVRP